LGELMALQRETVGLATGTRGHIQHGMRGTGVSKSDPPVSGQPKIGVSETLISIPILVVT